MAKSLCSYHTNINTLAPTVSVEKVVTDSQDCLLCATFFSFITFSLFFDQCGKKQDISRLKEEFFFFRNGWFTMCSRQFCFIIVLHCWDSVYMVMFVYMVTTAFRKQTAHDHINHCAASLSIFKFPFDSGFTQHTVHLTASGFHWWQASFMFY